MRSCAFILVFIILALEHCFCTVSMVLCDLLRLSVTAVRSRRAHAAENLFLRKQLALFQESKVKPRRANDSTRWIMTTLGRVFETAIVQQVPAAVQVPGLLHRGLRATCCIQAESE